ncbi:MAG: hypothetical protein A2Y10_15330 [Planctomycetes bacterium GWF2_41_51]|nr:MAG: hypothetical protein A2Y10_15330 [Planctomycetes bacterium GWF2_41_51]HBG26973.1 hypothetical protein [Phycisphaerales bacterium]
MIITSNGIEFMPLNWDFVCDGNWGQISFLVPKGTFKAGTNNGAYALEGVPKEYGDLASIINWDDAQLVYAAMPCTAWR